MPQNKLCRAVAAIQTPNRHPIQALSMQNDPLVRPSQVGASSGLDGVLESDEPKVEWFMK